MAKEKGEAFLILFRPRRLGKGEERRDRLSQEEEKDKLNSGYADAS